MAEEYNQAPSSVAASGSMIQARFGEFTVAQNGNLAAGLLFAGILPSRARILVVAAFRQTAASGAGVGGSTDVDVHARPIGGVDASILAAGALEIENSAGNNVHAIALANPALPAFDGDGLVLAAGTVITVVVDAIEAGATPPVGLVVTVSFQYC